MADTYFQLKGKLFINGGQRYIEDSCYVDYHDGAGLQTCGGNVFHSDGKLIGHADPPGPRGVQGVVGMPPKPPTPPQPSRRAK